MKKFIYLPAIILMLLTFSSDKVKAQCAASFIFSVDSSGVAVFTNTSIGNYDSTQWSFGDGTSSTLSNPVHTYNATGFYLVCLTIYTINGPCQSTICDTVVVGNPVISNCSASFTYNTVPGTTIIQFNNVSSVLNIFTWDFGDGSTSFIANPQHTYSSPGTYTVCLTVSDASGTCTDTFCAVVVINSAAICDAQFAYQGTGSTYFFYHGNNLGLTYNWIFGDGSNSSVPNPTHQFVVPGSYTVCLTITDSAQSCTNTYCDTITINNPANCQADFSHAMNPVFSTNIQFTDLSSGNITSWYWDFGDSTYSTLQNPLHIYATSGVYQVCLSITDSANNCTSTQCYFITAGNSATCFAGFSSIVDTSNGVSFTNTSFGTYLGVYWSFGDGTVSQLLNPFHQYAFPGAYLVCISLYMNGAICDSYCDSIIVGNPANACVPVFYSYPDSSLFGNGIVYFGVFNNCLGTQYVWDFGDSTVGSGLNPIHQYADSGWYQVCVTAYNPSGTFVFCDSVYANRIGFVGLNENAANNYFVNVYPNPLTGNGTAVLNLKSNSHVKLDVYSIAGTSVFNIIDGNMPQGETNIKMDVSGLQGGIYLLQLTVNGEVSHQKISVVK